MNKKPKFDVNQDASSDDVQDSFDEFNQDIPDDFPQDAYDEYKKDNQPDDFTQYEVSPVAERVKPSVKKRK